MENRENMGHKDMVKFMDEVTYEIHLLKNKMNELVEMFEKHLNDNHHIKKDVLEKVKENLEKEMELW